MMKNTKKIINKKSLISNVNKINLNNKYIRNDKELYAILKLIFDNFNIKKSNRKGTNSKNLSNREGKKLDKITSTSSIDSIPMQPKITILHR